MTSRIIVCVLCSKWYIYINTPIYSRSVLMRMVMSITTLSNLLNCFSFQNWCYNHNNDYSTVSTNGLPYYWLLLIIVIVVAAYTRRTITTRTPYLSECDETSAETNSQVYIIIYITVPDTRLLRVYYPKFLSELVSKIALRFCVCLVLGFYYTVNRISRAR